MSPEQLVPSRETCERMMRAGWKQDDALFYWRRGHHTEPYTVGGVGVFETADPSPHFAAPTFAEIAERLSATHHDYWQVDRPYQGTIGPRSYRARYSSDGPDVHGRGDTPTEALAALWIALNEKEKP